MSFTQIAQNFRSKYLTSTKRVVLFGMLEVFPVIILTAAVDIHPAAQGMVVGACAIYLAVCVGVYKNV